MRDSFVDSMHALLLKDRDVLLLTGDLGFGIFDQIRQDCPRQFINVGVAEQNMVGLSTGLSLMGKKIFCYSIANFSFMRGLEQFRNGPVYHNANVTIVCSGGGFTYGQLGFTHFAIEDYGILSSFGDVDILHPATSQQVRDSMTICHEAVGPKYLRLEKEELGYPVEAEIGGRLGLCRHTAGGKVAIVAIGSLLKQAMNVRERVGNVSVYSLGRHKSLDNPETLEELRRHELILVLEEHVVPNSVGQKIKARISDVPVRQLAISDSGPAVVGSQQFLRQHYGLTEEGIVSEISRSLAA